MGSFMSQPSSSLSSVSSTVPVEPETVNTNPSIVVASSSSSMLKDGDVLPQRMMSPPPTPPTPSTTTPDVWNDIRFIESVYAQIQREQAERAQNRWQYFWKNHGDAVLLRSAAPTKKRTTPDRSHDDDKWLRYQYRRYVRSNHNTDSPTGDVAATTTLVTAATLPQQQQQHSPSVPPPPAFTVQFRTYSRRNASSAQNRTQSVTPIPIAASGTTNHNNGPTTEPPSPLPPYMFCVPIAENFRVADQPELTFVPVLEKYDDQPLSRRNILAMHQTSYREDLVLYGPKCQQDQTNMMLDVLLQRLFHGPNTTTSTTTTNSSSSTGDAMVVPSIQHPVWETMAKVTGTTRAQVLRRVRAHAVRAVPPILDSHCATTTNDPHPTHDQNDDNDLRPVVTTDSSSGSRNGNANANQVVLGHKRNRLDLQYEAYTDSYRTLWCRQCFIYDCNLHVLNEKPSVEVQTMLAKAKERRHNSNDDMVGGHQTDIIRTVHNNSNITEMPEVGKSLFKQLYSIFEGNIPEIALALRVPISVVDRHWQSLEPKSDLLDVMPPLSAPKKNKFNYYSVKNYRQEWYNQYRDAKMFAYFYPCLHDNICQNTFNCSCIDNRFFCTDACSWNVNSPNYYRGCNCAGNCTQFCTCRLSKRECDPNLCKKCATCRDPPHEPVTTQKCCNDNLTMNRSPELMIGVSSVSGWGLYTRYALKEGDYVGKYIGELMSQDEADRRGLIADARERTYMFLISSDMSIDASRKGNKLRFINHSDHPNIESKTIFVQGQQEIGLFAICNIPEQTELFFDYYKYGDGTTTTTQLATTKRKMARKQK